MLIYYNIYKGEKNMYDIVIIGAGPAGSTLARQISKSKKKILIIDAENEKNKNLVEVYLHQMLKKNLLIMI